MKAYNTVWVRVFLGELCVADCNGSETERDQRWGDWNSIITPAPRKDRLVQKGLLHTSAVYATY